MTPTYQIRRAAKRDLDFLPEIERAASRLFPEGRLPDPDDVMPMPALEQAWENQGVRVAALDDTIVGFAVSGEFDGHLHLEVVAVHPGHGRRGVGTRLVTAVLEDARRRGMPGVTLTTFRDLPWNAPFYTRLGFRVLTHAELTPMLRTILMREERLGLTNRVAMVYGTMAGPGVPADAPPEPE